MGEKSIHARLREAMGDMANPTKSKKANVGKYSYEYATLPDVLGIVRPALQAHGLELKQFVHFAGDSLALTTAVFGDDGELVLDERPVYENRDPQAFGSFETYMRRYSLVTAFGLGVEDDDGQAARTAAGNPGQGASGRVERGVRALVGISPWTEETLAPVLAAQVDDEARVEWLASEYRSAKAQMDER